MKEIMHIPMQPEGSGYMTFNMQEGMAIRQDAAKLAQAVKKEAKMQRAVKALISQTLPKSGNNSEVVDTLCNNCQNKLQKEHHPRCSRCKTTPYCSRDCQAADWVEHKKSCEKQNFILKILAARDFLKDPDGLAAPDAYRTLSVPYQSTLEELHRAIQIAFGYTGESSWDFIVTNPKYKTFDPLQWLAKEAKIESYTVVGGKHYITPEACTAPQFSLFRFAEQDVRDTQKKPLHWDSPLTVMCRYSDRVPELLASQVKVFKLFEAGQTQQELLPGCPIQSSGSKIFYGYQFRNKWGNLIELVGRAPSTKTISCIDAHGAHLIEAVGDPKDFQMLRRGLSTAEDKRDAAMRSVMQKWQALGLTDADIVDDSATIVAVVNERIRRAKV